MKSESSSETAHESDHGVKRFVRFLEPVLLSFKLSSNSHVVPDRVCQAAADPWTAVVPTPHAGAATGIELQEFHILETEAESILSLAVEESIEDGMNSATEARLNNFVAYYSGAAVQCLAKHLVARYANAGTVADIVRVLGRVNHKESHDDRFWVAARLLRSETPLTRDASAVALEDLQDPRGVPRLQEALEAEAIPELRDDFELALQELKKSADGSHS